VGNRLKERALSGEIRRVVGEEFARYDELFELVKAPDEYR
jgi:type I restriction enzyme R subunit